MKNLFNFLSGDNNNDGQEQSQSVEESHFSGSFPVDDEFVYDARQHCWVLNGQVLSDEEAEVIYEQKKM